MTKEELEKEAEKKYCKGCKLRIEQCLWAWRNTNGLNEPNEKNCSCKEVPAYIAGAEPREKQIQIDAEQIRALQKQNGELNDKVKELEEKITYYKSIVSDEYIDEVRHRETYIAELKSENQKWKDEWQEQVQKATDEGYARTLQTIQLSKAKEIIKNLLSAYTTYADSFDDRDNEIVEEACQFISEVEK